MRAKRYQNSRRFHIFMRRTTIPNSSFEQSFHSQSKCAPPHEPSLNPSTYINPLTRMPKMRIGSTYLKYGFTQRGIFTPVPILTSAMYLSKPQP